MNFRLILPFPCRILNGKRYHNKRRCLMMKYGRTYNFSAGPAMMPEEVLEEIAAEMLN